LNHAQRQECCPETGSNLEAFTWVTTMGGPGMSAGVRAAFGGRLPTHDRSSSLGKLPALSTELHGSFVAGTHAERSLGVQEIQ
jgi:hypothetical protein